MGPPHGQSDNDEITSVQVALRIRPANESDAAAQRAPALRNLQGEVLNVSPNVPRVTVTPYQKHFTYDYVFSPSATQEDIFTESILRLVDQFSQGYNATVLAYGQTSSGKTYTMGTAGYLDTPPAHFGIIPRAVHTLFQSLRSQPISQFKYQVRVSFLEIYNEDLIDLLSGADRDGPRPPITIREDTRGKIIWTGVREVRVDSAEDVLAQLDAGSRIRQVGATDMNSVSSRSHAIFSLTLRQEKWVSSDSSSPSSHSRSTTPTPSLSSGIRPPTSSGGSLGRSSMRHSMIVPPSTHSLSSSPGPGADGEWVVLQSKFHFVDLAGSERLKRTNAVGDRAKEGISINAGLSALGNVISVLGDPTKKSLHVPYRDSKLTRLLQDSLGGNSRTLMIACVSPAASNITETVNTLKYANRARNIKNKATLNESISSTTDVDFLQAQVARLKAELRKFKGMSLQSDDTDYAAQVYTHESGFLRKRNESLEQELDSAGQANARLEEQCERLQGELIGLQDEFELTQRELLKIQQQGSRESNGKRGGGKKKKAGLVSREHPPNGSTTTPIHEVDEVDEDDMDSPVPTSFQQEVEPVIEEYEKVVQGLEARLADAREALAAAEASSQIAGAKLRFEETVRESNAVVIAELKGRVAELQEREIGANDYIRELEAQLAESRKSSHSHENEASVARQAMATPESRGDLTDEEEEDEQAGEEDEKEVFMDVSQGEESSEEEGRSKEKKGEEKKDDSPKKTDSKPNDLSTSMSDRQISEDKAVAIARLEKELTKLAQARSDMEASYVQYQQEARERESAEASKFQAQKATLERERSELKGRVAELEAKILTLEATDPSSSPIDDPQGTSATESLKQQLEARLQEVMTEAESVRSSLEEKSKLDLDRVRKENEEELSRKEREYSRELSKVKETMEDLEAKLKQERQSKQSTEETDKKVKEEKEEEKKEEEEEEVKEARKEMEKARSDMASLQARLTEALDKISTLIKEQTEFRSQVEGERSEKEAILEERNRLERERETLLRERVEGEDGTQALLQEKENSIQEKERDIREKMQLLVQKDKSLEEKDGEIKQLEGSLRGLEEKLDQANQDLKSREKEILEAREETNRQSSEVKDLELRLEEAKVNLEEARAEVEATKAQLEAARADLEQAQLEIRKAKADQEHIKEELDASRLELEGTERVLEETQAEMEALSTELQGAKDQVTERIKEISALQAQVSGEGEESVERVKALETQVTQAQETISNLEAQMTQGHEKLSLLETESSQGQERTKDLEAQLSQSQEKIIDLEAQLSQAKESMKDLEARSIDTKDLGEQKALVLSLQEKLDGSEKERSRVEGVLASKEEELSEFQELIQSLEEGRTSLTESLKVAEDQVTQLREDLSKVQGAGEERSAKALEDEKKYQGMVKALHDLEEALGLAEGKADDPSSSPLPTQRILDRIRETEASKESLEATNRAYQADIQDLEAYVTELSASTAKPSGPSAEALAREREEWDGRLKTLEEEKASLQASNSQYSSDLSQLEAEMLQVAEINDQLERELENLRTSAASNSAFSGSQEEGGVSKETAIQLRETIAQQSRLIKSQEERLQELGSSSSTMTSSSGSVTSPIIPARTRASLVEAASSPPSTPPARAPPPPPVDRSPSPPLPLPSAMSPSLSASNQGSLPPGSLSPEEAKGLKTRIQQLEGDLRGHVALIASLERSLAEAERSHAEARSRADAVTEQISGADEEKRMMSESLEALKRKVEETRSMFEGERVKGAQLLERNRALERQMLELKGKKGKLLCF